MVDLTNPVQTIVSILKDSSTGIGTSGYEITDDNASGLTISGGQLLVSFTMSKEELKDAFGGSQDYDVIFTVKSGEIEDSWIGLSTKIWKVPIIITIHVIDKWSAVATKYITAPLVLYKAVNALRTFIKAKTKSPGGSINIWEATSFKNEEDTTVKPTMYKCVVITEAQLYYNPGPAGVASALTVTLNSERINEDDTNLGTITENSTAHELPDTVDKEYGDRVQVTYTAVGNDEFSSWSVSGLVVVEDSTANPTYMRVNGTGTLTAIYKTTIELLNVDDFDEDIDGFNHYGDAPYLDAADDGNSCGQRLPTCGAANMRYFTFEDLEEISSVATVTLYVRLKVTNIGSYNESITTYMYNVADHSVSTSKTTTLQANGVDHTEYDYYIEWDLSAFFTTVAKVNLASMAFYLSVGHCYVEVDHAYLKVEA